MSPKKKTTRAPKRRPATRTTPTATPVAREAAVLEDPRRWPLALWAVLVLVWLCGSALTFVLAMAEATYITSGAEVTTQSRRDVVGYLIGLLVFAVGSPLAGAITAAVLRRWIAATVFALALLASAGLLFWLAPPGQMLAAISGAY